MKAHFPKTRKPDRGASSSWSRRIVRAAPFPLLTAVCIYFAGSLIAQTGREGYREAFDAWQQAQDHLERDAGTGGTALVQQSDRAASAAAIFETTRATYLRSVAEDAAQRRQLLQTAPTLPAANLAPPNVAETVTRELQTVTRAMARFADDKDRGIQQLRASLGRERDALTALNESIQARQKTMAATAEAGAALEEARAKTVEAFGNQASQLAQTVAQIEKERAAWVDYYEKLTQTIQIASVVPTRLNSAPDATRTEPVPSVPLARYVGAWTLPNVNGIFHGARPEFVDLVVHEQNGHVDGTLFGRFSLPAGTAGDPLVRFDFAGDFGATANQRFPLVSSDGMHGTVELIPGPAFNLLEVNFLIDPQSNKIRSGNFILVKK